MIRFLLARGGIGNIPYLLSILALNLAIAGLGSGLTLWSAPFLAVLHAPSMFGADMIAELQVVALSLFPCIGVLGWVGYSLVRMRIRCARHPRVALAIALIGSVLPPALLLMPLAGWRRAAPASRSGPWVRIPVFFLFLAALGGGLPFVWKSLTLGTNVSSFLF